MCGRIPKATSTIGKMSSAQFLNNNANPHSFRVVTNAKRRVIVFK